MSEQASEIISYNTEKRTTLDYFLLVGGWFVSCISLGMVGLIAYWAIKIPEKNVNSLPIINAIRGDSEVVEDSMYGFRAAAPAILNNTSFLKQKPIKWDPEKMLIRA